MNTIILCEELFAYNIDKKLCSFGNKLKKNNKNKKKRKHTKKRRHISTRMIAHALNTGSKASSTSINQTSSKRIILSSISMYIANTGIHE